jgi:alkanesulfonate monooxygenase SsuD/methylene tetrahydromethanopterin reductase-like flavin-dependent oxidoreductase (luciferase family)
MKNIGFLSFGHWTDHPESGTRTASDALLQAIDLAVAAEELGADGAYFRVHHFAQQYRLPVPAACSDGARTSRIEIGTAVIDMRYENPLYMAEDAGAADLISRRPAAAGHQQGFTRAGHRGVASLRLRPRRRRVGRRHGPQAHRASARGAHR